MEIRDIKSYDELRHCVHFAADNYRDMYFPVDKHYFLQKMIKAVKEGLRVKVILKDNVIVAWGGIAVGAPYLHSPEKEVSQMYYQTTLQGFSAVKALILFHKSMIEFAASIGVGKCTTTSIMDSQETFYKILDAEGWTRRGCAMVYRLTVLDKPKVVQGSRVPNRAPNVTLGTGRQAPRMAPP
jgi:hypothetical protein